MEGKHRSRSPAALVLFAVVLLTRPPLAIGQPAESASDPSRACNTEAHHALDGRIGTWCQATPDDRLRGETQVEKILDGCALWQDWHGVSGGTGASLNAFDEEAGVWRHMWVNGVSIVLLAEGERSGEHMQWQVSHISIPKDENEEERWVWSREEPAFNRVETSKDGGSTWEVLFDDRFHRWKGSLPPNTRPSVECSMDLEHHALAFWTGAWTIETEDGERIGDSWVDLIKKGCAMHEEGYNKDVGRYVRLMAYDKLNEAWRMLMATDQGKVHVAEGARTDSTMLWIVTDAQPDTHQIRWTLTRKNDGDALFEFQDDDTVLWQEEESQGGGAIWRTAATKIYRRH